MGNIETASTHGTQRPDPEPEGSSSSGSTAGSWDVAAESTPSSGSARRWAGLPRVMRWLGGTTLLVSAFSFLIGGYVYASALLRYYEFLGFTLLLSAAGALCVVRWKDSKGARTFLAIATAFLPAHFANLGGFVFASVHGEAELAPHLALLQMPGLPPWQLAGTLAVAVAVLALVSFAGFSAMARTEAKRLTLFYFIANAALLLPSREPNCVVGLGVVMLTVALVADWRWFSQPLALRSWDGRVVRAMLQVPLGVLVLRNLMVYGPSQAIYSFLLAVLGGIMFFAVPRLDQRLFMQRLSQDLALAPIALSWFLCAELLFQLSWLQSLEHVLVAGVFPCAVLMIGLSFFTAGSGRGHRSVGSAIAVVALTGQLLVSGSVTTSLLLTVTAITVVMSSFLMEEKKLLWAGVTGLLFGLGYHLHYALQLCQANLWLALALVGMAVVLLSSYLERNVHQCLVRFAQFQQRYHSWQ